MHEPVKRRAPGVGMTAGRRQQVIQRCRRFLLYP
jgi:hypothetical protein